MSCILSSLVAQPGILKINGIVQSSSDKSPIEGATLILLNSETTAISGADGHFAIILTAYPDTLEVRHIGFKTRYIPIDKEDNKILIIQLVAETSNLREVVVSTGYQLIPKERETGSFDFINNKLLNRNVSPDILDHIENLTPGLLFNHGNAANTDKFLIRGRGTIYANAQPLIVLNNFPYDGDINNINPDDIESISILKDAAAASIWGARAGNGVIVITTKTGRTTKPSVEFNSNITMGQRPDLSNIHEISSSDYIDLEKFLFSNGYYKYILTSASHSPVTPVVELLNDEATGLISTEEANDQIEQYKKNNALKDIQKYMYRPSQSEHNDINVSGNTPKVNYYMSAGWDRSLSPLVSYQSNRVTLRTRNTFKISKNFQINAAMSYVQNISENGNNPGYLLNSGAGKGLYPYAQLVDQKGMPEAIVRDYRKTWVDTVGGGSLLNWTYNPIEDIYNEKNTVQTRDYVANAGINYSFNSSLKAEIKYQYENQVINGNDFNSSESYFTRNLINKYTQVDPSTGVLSHPVPLGGILDKSITDLTSHQGRIQLNYNQSWDNSKHHIAAIAGWEIKDMTTNVFRDRLYGYDPDKSTVETNMDYVTYFPLYYYRVITSPVTNGQYVSKLTDRFISYYANASYTFQNRYTLSASGRTDEANLFGVKTNQKGVPLWSVGASWAISNEPAYSINWLPALKLRVTYGQNGNISRLASAYTTATLFGANTTPAIDATIVNPPNQHLTWEQVGTMNIGIDFTIGNRILYGDIEYYRKRSTNLMGQAPTDPTLGLSDNSGNSFFYGNVAAMRGSGVDVELNSNIMNRRFKWRTTFIFSYTKSEVTQYMLPTSNSGKSYLAVGINYINPVKGKPVFAYYSYRWGGLDPTDGDPQGYINGKISKDYITLMNNTPLQDMVYNGPAEPTVFGAIRNEFAWKNFSLSFNISYKLGYYFRRPSINYSALFSSWSGSSDYAQRWQKPGDERITNVPSLVYPANTNRDAFYEYSQILVNSADNLRLEDLRLDYTINKANWKRLPFERLQIYVYANNLGVLWVDNKEHLDPYYINVPKEGKQLSLGLNIHF